MIAINWYYPTGASDPIPCEWICFTESGDVVHVYAVENGAV
jgi:hypothetical protein